MKRVSLDNTEEPSSLEESVITFGRRALVGTVGAASLIGYINIYGDNELNEFDSFLRKTFPDRYKEQRIRPPLQPSFAAALADVFESVAVRDLKLLSSDKLRGDEAQLSAKAKSFFPGVQAAASDSSGIPLASLLATEAGCNLALYARLHTIAAHLPSPKSRKEFGKRVGDRVLGSSLVSGTFRMQDYVVRDPIADFAVWQAGLNALINAYTLGGFGVLTVGEKGRGGLQEEDWRQDRRAAFSLFVSDLALTDAAQVLAGEALDDMASALLPSLPLLAFLQAAGIQADAESYYMSSQYTRNPADYRPDGVAVQFNLEYNGPTASGANLKPAPGPTGGQ